MRSGLNDEEYAALMQLVTDQEKAIKSDGGWHTLVQQSLRCVVAALMPRAALSLVTVLPGLPKLLLFVPCMPQPR